MPENVILVDVADRPIGTEEKLRAHERGVLHRAFSVFIFNPLNKLLLQQRARHKYHSGGLWTNTCCSHPRPGESTLAAAHRRLQEEMGFDTALKEVFSFTYRVSFTNGLTEHEFDHVMVGRWTGVPRVNKAEVADYCWVTLAELQLALHKYPEQYTYWLGQAVPRLAVALNQS